MSEPENKTEPTESTDPYWWTPFAVIVGLVTYGLLGFLGVLTPKKGGLTAADVPVATASATATAAPSARPPAARPPLVRPPLRPPELPPE